jgi:3D (Asp-Asp-Asp) domain-containing protein
MDYTQPNMADPLSEDGYVRVIRVREKVIVEMEPVQFGTVYQDDPTVEIDNFSLIDAGTLGVRATRILLRLEDGEEVDRVVEETVEVLEPKPRIVGYGTKIVVRTMNTPDGPVEYWRAVSMYATAYSPCNSAADRCYPNTSSGKPVVKGVVAFVRRWYLQMKGWPLYVPDYGFATVEDVGGGIPGRYWIDLGFSDDDIVSWHQWVTVYFLTPVPPADAIPWILN